MSEDLQSIVDKASDLSGRHSRAVDEVLHDSDLTQDAKIRRVQQLEYENGGAMNKLREQYEALIVAELDEAVREVAGPRFPRDASIGDKTIVRDAFIRYLDDALKGDVARRQRLLELAQASGSETLARAVLACALQVGNGALVDAYVRYFPKEAERVGRVVEAINRRRDPNSKFGDRTRFTIPTTSPAVVANGSQR